MLRIGRGVRRTCDRWKRRELMKAAALPLFGTLQSATAASSGRPGPPAKSVILLWLWGGPPHLDTFDMKPNAPIEYRGPYAPVATSVRGMEICELLPGLARQAHLYSLIRSLNCSSNDHGIAGTIGLTGSEAGAISLGGQTNPGTLNPTHGSIVSKVAGFRPGMPRFLTIGDPLHQGHRSIVGEGGGSLGALFDPFRLNYQMSTGVRLPNLELADGVSPSGLESRRDLLRQVDQLRRELNESPAVDRMDQFYQQAFSLLTDVTARRPFDLEAETPATRRLYGRFRFGQCCLLARRLVEAGAHFVQVNWSSHVEPVEDTGDGGWDMHDRNFQQFQDRHAWMLDQSVSALLQDLDDRGMLSETVVVAVGEFGRTPKINQKSGRDHWHQCYSALVAGGGLRGGTVVGASDERAEFPIERPVTPADLFSTVLHQLGIGASELTRNSLLPSGTVIEELC